MTNLADTTSASLAAEPIARAAAEPAARDKRFLFGPVIDFLCLGGSSLLLLPFLFVLPETELRPTVATTMLLIANLVNHPHFAHSYQIFYRNYSKKAFRPDLGRAMQIRYIIAGIVAPIALVAFFAFAVVRGDARLLGYGGNIMGFFVGWHYVKQGYGMLMVDAVLKRRFFKDQEKKVFLVNSYAVWVYAWLSVNNAANASDLWGLKYYTFAIPQPILLIASAIAISTTAASLWVLYGKYRETGGLPLNGVLAYFVSIYLWLAFVRIDPLWLLVVPALHSLQYLVVVWRYELNYERGQDGAARTPTIPWLQRIFGSRAYESLVIFLLSGLLLGYLGFWGIPKLLDAYVSYDKAAFGGTMFLFMFWVFINVHHYFLDNVMWRRENPDTRKFLFS